MSKAISFAALAAVVVVLLIATDRTATSPESAQAQVPGTNGLIAFVRDNDIWTIKPDGTDEKRITNTQEIERFPAWSPDGQQIAYMHSRVVNESSSEISVWVMDADGFHQRPLTHDLGANEESWGPEWSPDGTKIAFTGRRGGAQNVFIMNSSDGSGVTNLTNDFGWFPAFSPDGGLIAYRGGDLGVWTMKPDGTDKHRVLSIDALALDWSPDGESLAYEEFVEDPTQHNVGTVASGGATPRTLDFEALNPSWSPDGKFIAYVGFSQAAKITVMDADGGNKHQLTAGVDPSWGANRPALDGVEFTQAIQQLQTIPELLSDLEDDGQPPVPMIAEKPAVMRVYFSEMPEQSQFIVEASGAVNGEEQVTIEPTCTPELRRKQEEGCFSVDFYFTPPPGQWSVNLKVRDFTLDVVEEHDFTFTSVSAVPIVLDAVSVCHERDEQIADAWICGSQDNFVDTLDFFQKVMPAPSVYLQLTGSAIYNELPAGTIDASIWWWQTDSMLIDLHNQRGNTGIAGRHLTAGAVGSELPTLAGRAEIDSRAFAAKFGNMFLGIHGDSWVAAHEAAHSLGVRHTNTEVPRAASAPGCYGLAEDPQSEWTHEDNFLHSETADETVEVGFDVSEQVALPGDEFLEMMGYCLPAWVSPRTYNSILTKLSTFNLPAAVPIGAPGPQWLVRGSINGGVTFGPLLEVDGAPSESGGDYTIQVLDGGDGVLAEHSFAPSSGEGAEAEGLPYFSELVPVIAAAAAIRVLDPGDAEIGRITLGGAAPVVSVTATADGDSINASWEITDADSGEFASLLYYSADGGATWEALGEVDDTSITLDAANLGGSAQAEVRVLVSDGVNTGRGESAAFVLAEHAPTAEITGPDGHSFHEGSLVWLQASAFDAEDGTLDGNALTWASSKDGTLGHGASLPLYDLSTGTHTITMTAKDSDNNTATDTITVTVSDRPLVEGEEPGEDHTWGDNDCDGEISSRDNQALSRKVLQQPALSQTQPCPALGDAVTIDGKSHTWGDLDCDGEISSRDNQALLRKVLQQNALSQTQPCPAVGDGVTTTLAAAAFLGWGRLRLE